MELFSKFKKDYFNYLTSIILPALISGISIPVFKRLLGAEDYGQFALWFNGILIFISFFTGWIAQSVIRFFPASRNKREFSANSLRLLLKILLVFIIPVAALAWYISKDWILTIFCISAMFAGSLHFVMLPVIQSSFLSRKVIYSELIRILIYVGGGVLLLIFSGWYFIYSLLGAVTVAYLSSFFYLWFNFKNRLGDYKTFGTGEENEVLLKRFYRYGIPLSLWFVFAYLLNYSDKLFSIHLFGGDFQGNYQAVFDLINKGLTLLIAPVITALFPLLTSAYEAGDREEIRQLIRKIFRYELLGFVIVSLGYWPLGGKLLLYILKIPGTGTFLWAGYLVVCGTFLMQFAVLAQKKYELRLKTSFLLSAMITAFFVQILFYFLMRETGNVLAAPFGYFIAVSVYLSFILFPDIKNIFYNFKRPVQ